MDQVGWLGKAQGHVSRGGVGQATGQRQRRGTSGQSEENSFKAVVAAPEGASAYRSHEPSSFNILAWRFWKLQGTFVVTNMDDIKRYGSR